MMELNHAVTEQTFSEWITSVFHNFILLLLVWRKMCGCVWKLFENNNDIVLSVVSEAI